jgi:hypothetical protein
MRLSNGLNLSAAAPNGGLMASFSADPICAPAFRTLAACTPFVDSHGPSSDRFVVYGYQQICLPPDCVKLDRATI